jgi:hypothetical protein
MRLSRREPVQLCVALSNLGGDDTIVSMELALSNQLSLEKSGFRASDVKRIEKFEKGGKKEFYYQIFPKQSTTAGERPVRVTIVEHYNDFNYVQKQYSKDIPLTIEE